MSFFIYILRGEYERGGWRKEKEFYVLVDPKLYYINRGCTLVISNKSSGEISLKLFMAASKATAKQAESR